MAETTFRGSDGANGGKLPDRAAEKNALNDYTEKMQRAKLRAQEITEEGEARAETLRRERAATDARMSEHRDRIKATVKEAEGRKAVKSAMGNRSDIARNQLAQLNADIEKRILAERTPGAFSSFARNIANGFRNAAALVAKAKSGLSSFKLGGASVPLGRRGAFAAVALSAVAAAVALHRPISPETTEAAQPSPVAVAKAEPKSVGGAPTVAERLAARNLAAQFVAPANAAAVTASYVPPVAAVATVRDESVKRAGTGQRAVAKRALHGDDPGIANKGDREAYEGEVARLTRSGDPKDMAAAYQLAAERMQKMGRDKEADRLRSASLNIIRASLGLGTS